MLNSNDFDFVKNQSHFLYSNTILAFYRKNDLTETKLGLSISKKYGNAVRRNRLKRVVREYFRCSKFKQKNISINIVPNLKSFNKKYEKDYSLFENDLSDDLKTIFQSIK